MMNVDDDDDDGSGDKMFQDICYLWPISDSNQKPNSVDKVAQNFFCRNKFNLRLKVTEVNPNGWQQLPACDAGGWKVFYHLLSPFVSSSLSSS